MDTTVIIPVGPGHEALAETAQASASAQSVPCRVIAVFDDERRGPGWARNTGLARADTEFVVFLDADDALHPQFAEKAQAAWRPGHYVYTSWYEGNRYVSAPACADWKLETWHLVTALIPTAWARRVGGFDESLPGDEDTDFYKKLLIGGCCGIRVEEPLVFYGPEGQRSRLFRAGSEYAKTKQLLQARYQGKPIMCCGQNGKNATAGMPEGRSEGDILCRANWSGNRVITGQSGRRYGKAAGRRLRGTGNGALVWVAPDDVRRMPKLFVPVDGATPAPTNEGKTFTFDEFAAILGDRMRPANFQYPQPIARPETHPDWQRIAAMGQEALSV